MVISPMDISRIILHCDENLLVINKPAGIRSIPDGYHPGLPHLKTLLEPEFGPLFIIHRLDKDTSGLILLARNPEFHKALNQLFDSRQISKTYAGIIMGLPAWTDYSADEPLTINGDRDHRTRIFPKKGKPASTKIHVDLMLNSSAVITAQPLTGYTHQIRAHLSYMGYPILFDELYTHGQLRAKAKNIIELTKVSTFPRRTMLHSIMISFLHPVTQLMTTYQAPIPPDMEEIISILKK